MSWDHACRKCECFLDSGSRAAPGFPVCRKCFEEPSPSPGLLGEASLEAHRRSLLRSSLLWLSLCAPSLLSAILIATGKLSPEVGGAACGVTLVIGTLVGIVLQYAVLSPRHHAALKEEILARSGLDLGDLAQPVLVHVHPGGSRSELGVFLQADEGILVIGHHKVRAAIPLDEVTVSLVSGWPHTFSRALKFERADGAEWMVVPWQNQTGRSRNRVIDGIVARLTSGRREL